MGYNLFLDVRTYRYICYRKGQFLILKEIRNILAGITHTRIKKMKILSVSYLRRCGVDIVEKLGGAGEACQAHNLKVSGSKPLSAISFSPILKVNS